MKKIVFSLFGISFLLNYLPSFANDSLAEDIDQVGNDIKAEHNDLKERKNQRKKKGKSKIIIRPDDEDIVLTLDREAEEDKDSSDEE